MTEAIFIRKHLRPHLEAMGARVIKYHGGVCSEVGVADLLCCFAGFFVAIEVKVGSNRPTASQLAFLRQIHHAGGIAGVITDKNWQEDIKTLMREGYVNFIPVDV